MGRVRIKFCGITRAEDAVAAADAGADAIGINFHSASARKVSIERAGEILAVLPPFVTPVGLFVDSDAAEILDTTRTLHLRHVQLHGEESPEMAAKLSSLIIIKAVRVDGQLSTSLARWKSAKLPNLVGFLVDSATAVPGGSGVENDWAALEAARKAGVFEELPALIAAGGLTPMNVASVIRRIRPWAVDVSSGVESSRGIKSAEKMQAFADAVRGA